MARYLNGISVSKVSVWVSSIEWKKSATGNDYAAVRGSISPHFYNTETKKREKCDKEETFFVDLAFFTEEHLTELAKRGKGDNVLFIEDPDGKMQLTFTRGVDKNGTPKADKNGRQYINFRLSVGRDVVIGFDRTNVSNRAGSAKGGSEDGSRKDNFDI